MNFLDKMQLLKGFKCCGISIWINSEDELVINKIILEKRGKKLHISNLNSFNSLNEFKLDTPINLPIYLSIDGKGVIHKKTDLNSGTLRIETLLPDSDSKDFVIQEVTLGDKTNIVSLSRKNRIDNIVNKISELGYDTMKISLGPFSIGNISNQIQERTCIELPFCNVFLMNSSINGFERNNIEEPDFNLNIDSGIINSKYIIPFSNCIIHFIGNDSLTMEYPELNHTIENYRFRRLFQISGWTILIFLFLVLFTNYFVFDNYRNKNQLMTKMIVSNKEILNRIDKLKIQIKKKEEFYKNNLTYSNPAFVYYVDRIAKEVPLNITLSRLCISPVIKTSVSENIFKFQRDKIFLSGNSQGSKPLDTWIKALKKYTWVKDISIKNYSDDNVESAKFELEISTK